MMSMFALCACNASVRSHGPTCWLMYADSARSVGSVTAWTSVMCPLEITTRTCTSPKRFGKSAPVKVPVGATDADGEGEGEGVVAGVAEGEGTAEGEADGLAGLPAFWVGDTGAIALNWCGVTL